MRLHPLSVLIFIKMNNNYAMLSAAGLWSFQLFRRDGLAPSNSIRPMNWPAIACTGNKGEITCTERVRHTTSAVSHDLTLSCAVGHVAAAIKRNKRQNVYDLPNAKPIKGPCSPW